MHRFLIRVKYALQGWAFFFSKERNGQIQMVVAVLVVIAGFYFGIRPTEWLAVLLCIALVVSLEMVNTAIEKTVDHLHPDQHEQIGIVKDVAAGGVLWASVLSAVIGGVVFWPYVKEWYADVF